MRALCIVVLMMTAVNCHQDMDASLSESSSESEVEPERRANEGIPIEVPALSRRTNNLENSPASEETGDVEMPVYPPLDHRYRRIYQADETASIEDYPFMAAILMNDKLWCGGAIISRDIIITAAHCLQVQYNNRFFREYVKMLTVRVGSQNATSGGEILRVIEIKFHPNYKPRNLEFNVALLKIHKNISIERKSVDAVEHSTDKVVPVDKVVRFLGWGSVLGYGVGDGGLVLLQKLDLPIYDLSDCQAIYGRDLVTRTNFCAGYISMRKNVCNHDAGGPALLDGKVIGVLSFSAQRCDVPDRPAVFTNIGMVSDWIADVAESISSRQLKRDWIEAHSSLTK